MKGDYPGKGLFIYGTEIVKILPQGDQIGSISLYEVYKILSFSNSFLPFALFLHLLLNSILLMAYFKWYRFFLGFSCLFMDCF